MTNDSKPEPAAETGAANEASVQPEPLRGPGHLLRGARERARTSLDSLAAQTKLARATLEALERDDFATLNEPVYVRGYYRKCAKALGLPEAELIAAYEKRVGPKPPPPPPTRLLLGGGNSGLERSRRPLTSWLVWLVVVIAAGGFLGWLLRAEPGHHPVTVTMSPAPLAATPAAPPLAPPPAAPEPGINDSTVTPATTPPAETPAATAGPSVSSAPSSGQGLSVSFKATSWVRIEDSTGKLLLSGVIQAGDHHDLAGTPPYSVYIGNARGVALEYAGKPVSLDAYIKDNDTAKLTVPAGN